MRPLSKLFSLLIGLSILLLHNSHALPVALAQDGVYRTQLWLVQATAAQLRSLANMGVVVYTTALSVPDRYFAGGDAAALARAQAAGVQVTVLDPDTTGKVYYFADATVENAAALVAPYGAILYQDAQEFLLAFPAADEERVVAELPAQGVELAELPATAYVPPPDFLAAAALPSQLDPYIQSLVEALAASAVYDRIADLSGARSTTVGGANVTIATRYTYSSQIKLAEQYLFESYQRMGLQPQYVPWSYSNASGKNVIADIRGVTHPERIWLIGGHFDATSNNPTVLAPGADDNGSGTAATLVIASLLSGQSFDDTIRFVHFSGEEQGMWGSKVYAAQLQASGAQVMGYLDLDMIGWDGNSDGVIELHSGTGAASNQLAQTFVNANQLYGQNLVIEIKSTTANRFSDHSSFWDKGYPAILDIENFFDDSPRARDRNPYYHNTGDTLTRVNLGYVHRNARAALATISQLAGIVTGPTRTPTQTPTRTLTPTATATPVPGACAELIVNGGFETADAWLLGQSGHPPLYVPMPVHGGSRALQMGLPAGGNAVSYSSARQKLVLPTGANKITLTYWEHPGGGDSGDYREVLLLNAAGLYYRTLDRAYGAGSNQWQVRTVDLESYTGQTVYLYFNTYNNGSGALAWNYLDDVSVQSCAPGAGTPTPTASATWTPTTAPPTATETWTATATTVPPTPTETWTATPTTVPPTPTETWTATATTVPPTPTNTFTPTLTPTPTPTSAQNCTELVANGGFEENGTWTFGYTSRPAGYVTSPVFAGARALRMGILPGTANATSYSSVRQILVLPSNPQTLTLTFQQRPGTGDAYDYRETILFDATGRPRTLERAYGAGSGVWTARTFDLMPYRGQTVTLYFNVYNNGAGSLAYSYLDEVSVRACAP